MPATAPPPASTGQLTRRAQPAQPRPRPEPRPRDDADRLADHVAEQDPQRDRRRDGVGEQLAVDVDADVREREQRDDHEARPGMEAVLDPLVRRDRRGDAELGRARELGRRLLAERARELRDPLEVRARRRIRARDQADRQPGDHRIDAGLEQRAPHRRPDDHGDRPAPRDRREAQRQRARRRGRRRPRAGRTRRAPCTPSRSPAAPRGRRRPRASAGRRAAASPWAPAARARRARTRCRSTSRRPSRGRPGRRR